MTIAIQRDLYQQELDGFRAMENKAWVAMLTTPVCAYLQGVMGITGICTGFALDSATRVERWVRSGVQNASLELADHPTRRIQHLEKLLILAVFQSIGHNDDYREIRPDWDAPLVDTVHKKYATLIKDATGGIIKKRLPANGYQAVDAIGNVMDAIQQQARWEDHFLVVFAHPQQTLYKWHVVYLHPKAGIIADGARCFSWRISDKAQKLFSRIAADYLQRVYNHHQNFFIYGIGFEDMPTRPLLQDRVLTRAATLCRMALYNPFLAVRFGLSYLVPQQYRSYCLPSKTFAAEFYGELAKQIYAKNFPRFFALIDKQRPRIPEGSEILLLKGDLRGYLPFLEGLKERGVQCDPIASWVQQAMLNGLGLETKCDLDPDQAECHRGILRAVLDYRKTLQESYSLNQWAQMYGIRSGGQPFVVEFFREKEFGDYPFPNMHNFSPVYQFCQDGKLELLKQAVGFGADPYASFYPEGDRPIDAARKGRRDAIVTFLNEHVRS